MRIVHASGVVEVGCRVRLGWLVLALFCGCSGSEPVGQNQDDAVASSRAALTAQAPSSHYVVVTSSSPLGAAAALPSSYVIRDSSGALLEITGATANPDGTQITLATATQQPTEYELFLANDLRIGAAGFVGSSQREPFLESAISTSDTSVHLTFSERMDRQLAETLSFYRLADPDTDQDVDIDVLSADLQDDLRTVILRTSPQQNRLYTVQATQLKSRFSCDDGDVSKLAASDATLACAESVRPLTTDGAQLRLELTARTNVDRNAPNNPEATGTVGTVKPANSGLGVGSSTCTGNPCASSTGNSNNEELTLEFDVPTRADTVVLGVRGFGNDALAVFVSSAAAPGFDYTIPSTALRATAVGDGLSIYFDQQSALPADLLIDRVRVRTVAGHACLSSICVSDGRTVDPTRNVANFWGTPTFDDTPPRLVEAASTSPTTVLVTFNEPLDSEAADPTHYRVGPNLTVTAAVQTEYQTQVLLTTTAQSAGTAYTLDVSGVRDRARNPIDPSADSATFSGISSELFLETAIALSATQVKLTFSEPMDIASLENIANYSITDPDHDIDVDITILGADASADGRSVVLTTTPQANILYQIVVTNIRGRNGDFFIDSSRNTALFQGIPAPDAVAPRVLSAVSVNDHSVLVTFSEPLRVESANAANFTITPGLTVSDAALTAQQDQILLTTSSQQADVLYTVTVSGVEDKAGRAIAAPPGNAATFVFDGGPETVGAGQAPRVVGAASSSNTSVVVTFSKAMSDDAIAAGNYAIVQANVNPEVGFLGVVSARFIGADRTAVELTTRSQNEVTYTVFVTNVRDRSGNQLAAREVSAGVLIDPRSASFAGSPWSCVKQCDNGSDGLGGGRCESDHDCTTDGVCSAADVPACSGSCVCDPPDADEDGLADYDEQRGWLVHVQLVNGQSFQRQVTGNPDTADSDGDGLDDALERLIGSDPRDIDTDDDKLGDYEEYNVIYSSPNDQDSDGDGADDFLEVEFYKTNALAADSDGDGYDDSDELFGRHRSPQVADLPGHAFTIGSVRLALDQRFTYVDGEGNTRAETIATSSTLQQEQQTGTTNLSQTVGHWLLGAEFGLDSCQSDCPDKWTDLVLTPALVNRLKFVGHVEGGMEFTSAHTEESSRATSSAFQEGIERGNELSVTSEVSREVVGASIRVDVTFQNPSNVAITLRNVELRAATTDPADPTHLTPLATLVPESTLLTGQPLALNIGPGQTRGAVVFANRDMFPSVIEDLMRAPRGIVFSVANYDLETGDQRNFAQGLQAVRERTVGIRIDKGDGTAKQLRVIAAGTLNRPRDDLRCAETGSHPGQLCSNDGDCGDSAPCEGGRVIGGFSEFDGVSGPTPLPLDFILQNTLGLRKTRPAVIIAAGTTAHAVANPDSDDVQVAAPGATVAIGDIVVAPGRDGILQSAALGTDYASEGMRLLAGANGTVDSEAAGDDIQVIATDTFPLAPAAVVVAAGPNGVLDTSIAGDDELVGPDGLRAGTDGSVQSFARGDDVQLIPVGTRGLPEDAVAISGGANGVLDSAARGDDVADVVTGYEVSRTCSAETPFRILRGPDGEADTKAEDGVCQVAFAPHFPGEECHTDDDCGADPDTDRQGRCAGDVQVTDAGDVVVRPGPAGFLDSVPADDDVYIGPGIPCTFDADCTADGVAGICDGTQQVVRVEERRNGQFRRTWALMMSDDTQFQTDFGAIGVRAGDEISLAFVQDIDRDGLVAQTEYLVGSSDYRKDTDDEGLSDFAEVRVGWEVGVEGQPLRRVLPDPRRKDTDGDGLSDLEELDLRTTHCACEARGPKLRFGSGNLLRSASPSGAEEARPCNSDFDCGGASNSCRDATECTDNGNGTWSCPACSDDVTLARTDPRARDTDGDLLSDHEEVFGYLTGAGVVDPQQPSGASSKFLVLAGSDRRADTVACPGNHCIDNTASCQTDGDCAVSRACVYALPCDDVQVVAPGTRVADPRTVVAIVSASASAAATDVVAPRVASALSDSRLGGDDVLAAGLEQSVIDRSVPSDEVCEDGTSFPFCSAIKPGADGLISSIVGGNDALILGGLGQSRETSNPLSSDSDQDLYRDGYERLLGSSPNVSGDAFFSGDLDGDGLTDSMERLEHNVAVIVGNQVRVSAQVSEVLLSDTDFDGLPDYAERNMPCSSAPRCVAAPAGGNRCSNSGLSCLTAVDCACTGSACACPTNPNATDSDGDGLSDLDELSADQLAVLARYGEIFPGYLLASDDSLKLGTDPGRSDADGDGLSDYFELYTGWLVQRYDGTVSRVFSDPRLSDSDGDGMDDGDEEVRKVDPKDPDTDDDGRVDGIELESNPNRPDLSVTITYAAMQMVQPNEAAEWLWGLHVQGPSEPFPGTRVSSGADCPVPLKNGCQCETNLRDLSLNKSINLTLGPGEAFVLNGAISEVYEDSGRSCPDGITDPYRLTSYSDDGRYMHFIEQPVTYESLQSRQFTSRSIALSSMEGGIAVTLFVEIFVNCEGSARGICRPGSTCLSNLDCESNNCSGGICVDLCGNGTVNTGELCDDGNNLECGTCSAQCDLLSATPADRCPTGVACRSNADCSSNSCSGGRCAPRCGDGLKDSGESCDDNNDLACGTCNATCSGVGTGATCTAGTRCRSDGDCAGTCSPTTGLCVAPPSP